MKTARIRCTYPDWLARLSARVTRLEQQTLPLTIVEQAKGLAPDARRLLAHCITLRGEVLELRATIRRQRMSRPHEHPRRAGADHA